MSLSILCSDGRARLLACNRQHVRIDNEQLTFAGVSVNAIRDVDGHYARLAQDVAGAVPGLWGYVGIDVIDSADGPTVVEINPRLTTSYTGLRRAFGVNTAQLVLALPDSLEDREASVLGTVINVEVTHAT